MSTTASVFTTIYRENLWGSESRSGHGSSFELTRFVRTGLSQIIQELQPSSLLDLPCGDGEWMSHVVAQHPDLEYIGGDIVNDIALENNSKWPQHRWFVMDVCTSDLLKVDVIFCRDCLVHLPIDMIFQALRNIKRSGSKYLVTTTFPQIPEGNGDIPIGSWRRLDLSAPPFNLPDSLMIVNECHSKPPGNGDKSLGVWCLEDLDDGRLRAR